MSPQEKYGDEFFCDAHVLKKADGGEHPFLDIGVCIMPRADEASTLAYAWEVMRELAHWAVEHFAERPNRETYRIVVAWSKRVRSRQGHIVKVWLDIAGLREVGAMRTPEECARRFGQGWTPLTRWQKDVFEKKLNAARRPNNHGCHDPRFRVRAKRQRNVPSSRFALVDAYSLPNSVCVRPSLART